MPTLINKHRSYVLHKQFLKSYSNLSQSILLMKNDLGIENLNKEYATYHSGLGYSDASRFYQEFDKYLKVVDKVEQYSIKNYNATAESGKDYTGNDNPNPLCVLLDGSSVGRIINGAIINFYVDVNGPKKGPNRYGFDVFRFQINSANDAVVPIKMSRLYSDEELENVNWPWVAGAPCSKKSNQAQNGMGCSYYALNDINPDDESKKYWDSLPW